MHYRTGAVASAGLLWSCAGETSWREGPAPSNGTPRENLECSLLGRLTCRAMASGTGAKPASCTASRKGATLIETCGTVTSASAPPAPPQPQPTSSAAGARSVVRLTWTDNSSDETGFVIERCDPALTGPRDAKTATHCPGGWQVIANLGANSTSYLDHTVIAKQTYIYRVKATNQFGSSSYTAEAVITAPDK